MSALVIGCGASRSARQDVTGEDQEVFTMKQRPVSGAVRAMPFAYIYRTNGDYNTHVTVNLNDARDQLVSYPAVTDVSVDSEPLKLIDGWLLDRRGGISLTTGFLRWTYPEYHAMTTTPSIDAILSAVIPDARVVEVRRLDMTTFDAQRDTSSVNRIIRGWSDTIRFNALPAPVKVQVQ